MANVWRFLILGLAAFTIMLFAVGATSGEASEASQYSATTTEEATTETVGSSVSALDTNDHDKKWFDCSCNVYKDGTASRYTGRTCSANSATAWFECNRQCERHQPGWANNCKECSVSDSGSPCQD